MNQHIKDLKELVLQLPEVVDHEVAGDIETESVFVSPAIDRIVVNDDMKTARVVLSSNTFGEEVADKAKRFLEVMAKQERGFEIKVFNENTRKDTGPYEQNVNAKLVDRGWLHDYGKGQFAYSGRSICIAGSLAVVSTLRMQRTNLFIRAVLDWALSNGFWLCLPSTGSIRTVGPKTFVT